MTRYDMMIRGGYSSLEEMDEAYRQEEAGAKRRLAVMRAKEGLEKTDYISREEVLEHSEYTENFNLVVPVRFIKAMKAADVQPAKRGRWIISNLYAQCSECSVAYDLDTFQRLIPMNENVPRHCSYCGADMRGGAENDT